MEIGDRTLSRAWTVIMRWRHTTLFLSSDGEIITTFGTDVPGQFVEPPRGAVAKLVYHRVGKISKKAIERDIIFALETRVHTFERMK